MVCVHAGDATGGRQETVMGLSCCRRPAKFHRQNPDVIIRQKSEAALAVLSQKRTLKMQLKVRWRTDALWKDSPQMFHGLKYRFSMCADRRRLFPAESRSHRSQAPPQSATQAIDRFQRERQPKFFSRGFDGKPRQHFHQPPPHQRGCQGVPWQNVRQHKRKGFAATIPLPAIGTKHALATNHLATGLGWIIAPKKAVPIQRFNLAAAGAALLFE